MEEIQKTKDREKTFDVLLSEVKGLDEKWKLITKESERILDEKWKKEDSLYSDYQKLEKEIQKDDKEYLKMIRDHEKEIQKEISKNIDLQKKVIEGKSSLQDLKDGYKHPREIRKEMMREFREKIRPIIEAIRLKKHKLWVNYLDRLMNRMNIVSMKSDRLKNLAFYLDQRKKKIDFYMPSQFESEGLMKEMKRVRDRVNVVKIGAIPMNIQFPKIDSLERLELLILSPVIQPEHEEELDELISRIKEKGFEWGDISLIYSPGKQGINNISGFIKINENPKYPEGRSLTIGDIDQEGREERSRKVKKSPELGDLK